MALFPIEGPVAPHVVMPWSANCIGVNLITASVHPTNLASAVWPGANDALFVPLYLRELVTIGQVFWYNGATVGNGTADFGIYTSDGRRLFSTAAVTTAGASALQKVDVSDKLVPPGSYYMALALSSASDTVFRVTAADVQMLRGAGVFKQASASPLPATATFATVTAAYLPMFGFTLQSVI